jgi:hypothetical protein
MTDFRALCAELLEAWEHELGELAADNRLVKRARAALAQVEPEGEVSDDELHDAFYRHSFEDFRQRLMTWQEFHAGARAAIALDRSRRAQPAPPAEGEVSELVADLSDPYIAPLLRERTRAAELLSQLAPVKPVPVGERLPGTAQQKIRSGPESPLVERVADAIAEQATSAGIVNDRPARAAILQVAMWLREQGTPASGWAMRLEQEASND